MKKILTSIFAALCAVLLVSKPVSAITVGPFAQGANPNVHVTAEIPGNPQEGDTAVTFEFKSDLPYFDSGQTYAFMFLNPGNNSQSGCGNFYKSPSELRQGTIQVVNSTTLRTTLDILACHGGPRGNRTMRGQWIFDLWQGSRDPHLRDRPQNLVAKLNFWIVPKGGEPTLRAACQVSTNQPIEFRVENSQSGLPYHVWLDGDKASGTTIRGSGGTISGRLGALGSPTDKKLCLEIVDPGLFGGNIGLTCRYSTSLKIVQGAPDPNCTNSSTPTAHTPSSGNPTKPYQIIGCGSTGGRGISTALGCIPVGDTNEFVGWFLKWALGISGGIAFLLMIIAGFQIMTSTGNPDKIQGGKELLNAAISGLVLIIFSVFLLKLIGVDILGLPGFGS